MKGGYEIIPLKDTEFKYTVNKERILFNKNAYPVAWYLIQAIQSMPWNEYIFSGETAMYYKTDNNNSLDFKTQTVKLYADLGQRLGIEPVLPYYYFGGCCYELFNGIYKKEVSLRDYVDPTGDIDIRITLPMSYYENPSKIEYDFANRLYEMDGDTIVINQFADHYTQWIMREFEKQLQLINPTLQKHLFENTVPFTIEEDDEIKSSKGYILKDLDNNLKLVRSIILMEHINNEGRNVTKDKGMIKIQLIAKYEGMEKPDHLLEFVLPIDSGYEDIFRNDDIVRSFRQNYTIYDSVQFKPLPLESLYSLYYGNIYTAIPQRKHLWNDPELRHKFYNHVGRLQYLDKLLPTLYSEFMEKYGRDILISKYDFDGTRKLFHFKDSLLLLSLIKTNLFDVLNNDKKDNTICTYDYRYEKTNVCDKKKIIDSLVTNLISILSMRVNNGKLSFKKEYLRLINPKQVNVYIDSINELVTISGGAKKSRKTRKVKRKRCKTQKKILKL
jgi:hypothetical protein